MTIFLSPEQPRWRPQTEQDIADVIAAGLLTETHHLDMKRRIGPSSGDRKELARDLSSFAIDGGALLIGVDELKEQRTWQLAPQTLDGLAERVDQIATQLVDPPLFVSTTDIHCAAGTTAGYLFIEVLASPRAPHMVEGIYYGRGDRTRVRLSDAEVLRHHTRRESIDVQADRLLDAELARDPSGPGATRQCGRIYGVAQPFTAGRDAGRSLITSSQERLHQVVRNVDRLVPDPLRESSPSLASLNAFSRRAQGVALSSHVVSGPGRSLQSNRDGESPREESMVDVELRHDAGVRLLVGRLTATWGRSWRASGDDDSATVIFDALFVAYALRLVLWAAAMGEATGYRGSWLLGVHGNDLRGLPSFHSMQSLGGRGHAFDAEDYREATVATHLELLQQPGHVAERLAGRLVQALGTESHYGGVFQHDPLDHLGG